MSFQTVEQLQATVAEQALEIKRLTGCLAKANANHEHFEREWYLSGDQIASLTAENERLREALETIQTSHVPDQPASRDVDPEKYIHEHHTKLRRYARAALQPKEGDQ